MREPAPPDAGEGPHALWHLSESAVIERFEPHVAATAESSEPRVWAVDTRHQPFYWFPRDCPRGTFWAAPNTAPEDVELLGDARRVHIVEASWLDRIRTAQVFAYRLPAETFTRDREVGGYWVSRETVVPVEVVALGDLVKRHVRAEIALRVVPSLWPIWRRVVASTLEYSGIRLRNARPTD